MGDDYPLEEPPTRVCCFKRHWGPVCPDGLVMCEVCFDRVTPALLHRDTDGVLVSVCADCADPP